MKHRVGTDLNKECPKCHLLLPESARDIQAARGLPESVQGWLSLQRLSESAGGWVKKSALALNILGEFCQESIYCLWNEFSTGWMSLLEVE